MLDNVTLAIRVTETKRYGKRGGPLPEDLVPGWSLYAVMLTEQALPEGESHPECHPLGVVCAAKYATMRSQDRKLWGWVHLTPDSKQEIGEDLLKWGAQPGEWWNLILEPDHA